MTLFSRREEDVVSAVIDAFRPPDCPIATPTAVDRALRFVNALDQSGSDRVAELRRILGFLDLALALVDLKDRDAVRRRLTDLEQQSFPFSLIPESRGLARFAQRLAILCLYASFGPDQRPAAALPTGYRVFADRGTEPATLPPEPVLPPELFVLQDQPLPDHTHDVVVVGSGAAGSVLVRRLVEDGLDVALIEAGDYVPEGRDTQGPHLRPRPLPHDEMENLLRYYRHGGLQLTEGIPMFVFQGQCLGGSSVINNAVCFRMPDRLRDDWAERFGIPWAATGGSLGGSYDRIAAELGIRPATDVAAPLNPSGDYLRTGAAALSGRPLDRALAACDVNLRHDPRCLGCGYCNLACAWLRKNSVLQTMLPAAARSVASGRGRLTIYTGRTALHVVGSGTPFVANGVRVATRRKHGRSQGVVAGRKIVVSAGAIGSTGVLERTPELRALGLPLGDFFSCNFGSPVHAEFDAPVHAWQGLQIAHWFDPGRDRGFVIETWYNPPATQALALPGWMDAMTRNLARYDHYACAAPLVGSTARSSVDGRGERGERVHIRFTDQDLARLKDGLRTVCEMFARHPQPPRRLLLGTLDDWELAPGTFADRIDRIASFADVQVGTGHPQGGNSLGGDGPAVERRGVVTPDFAVRGTRSLFCADASVFPTSLGVNPHWTVMAVADLAAPRIVGA